MKTNESERRTGRETRLLILVVVISLTVLLLLARLRFPAADLSTVAPSTGPLAGLAARATFDEMSATLVGLLNRLTPALVMVRLEPVPARGGTGRPAAGDDPPRAPGAGDARFMAGLRVRPTLALVHVPAGFQPSASPDLANPVEVVAADPERGVALVRLAPTQESSAASSALPATMLSVGGFSYFGMVQATASGATISPVFIGRVEPVDDPRWPQPLISVAPGPQLAPGAIVFTIDGRLVGLVIEHQGRMAVVPAVALNEAVNRLASPGAGSP